MAKKVEMHRVENASEKLYAITKKHKINLTQLAVLMGCNRTLMYFWSGNDNMPRWADVFLKTIDENFTLKKKLEDITI